MMMMSGKWNMMIMMMMLKERGSERWSERIEQSRKGYW
jgi:hypothetical protein